MRFPTQRGYADQAASGATVTVSTSDVTHARLPALQKHSEVTLLCAEGVVTLIDGTTSITVSTRQKCRMTHRDTHTVSTAFARGQLLCFSPNRN